jgi:hypothetical protein
MTLDVSGTGSMLFLQEAWLGKSLKTLSFARNTPPGPKPQNRRLCRRHVLEGEHLFMTHALPNTSVEALPKPDGAYVIVFACAFVSSG